MTTFATLAKIKGAALKQTQKTSYLRWHSNCMEPFISFGDTVEVKPTNGIDADAVYLMVIKREHINPIELRHLCAPELKVIRRITRLGGGLLRLSSDSPTLGLADEIVDEDDLKNWRIAGKVAPVRRSQLIASRQDPLLGIIGVAQKNALLVREARNV